MKVKVPSLRVAIDDELTHQDQNKQIESLLAQLDEKRLHMQANACAYQLRLSKAYEGDREIVIWFSERSQLAVGSNG